MLDTLHDPQNFGTLLRTADVLGLEAVVLPRHRSVHVTPSVVRASAGAVEHLTIPVVSNLSKAIEELQEIGFWVAGLDMEGDRHYWDLDMTGPTAIVVGGEDHGLGRLVKEKCDFLVKLPMSGHINSLNASTAGSRGALRDGPTADAEGAPPLKVVHRKARIARDPFPYGILFDRRKESHL